MNKIKQRLEARQPLWANWYVDEYIGGGASSEVYRLTERRFGQVSAVKVISWNIKKMTACSTCAALSTLKEYRKRAESEIRVMYELQSCPYIVHCKNHDFWDYYDDNMNLIGFDVLIQMDYWNCLQELLFEEGGSLKESDVLKFAKHITNALVAAHSKGIIHRDIKPENIFVDNMGNYLLGDFGVSKQSDNDFLSTTTGTKPFMAPEIYSRQRYDRTVDIYSLGIVMYMLLNDNRLPFITEQMNFNQAQDAIYERLSGKPIEPPAHGSEAIKKIVLKCCAFRAEDRFATAAQLLEALNSVVIEESCGGITTLNQEPSVISSDVDSNSQKTVADIMEEDFETVYAVSSEKTAEISVSITEKEENDVGIVDYSEQTEINDFSDNYSELAETNGIPVDAEAGEANNSVVDTENNTGKNKTRTKSKKKAAVITASAAAVVIAAGAGVVFLSGSGMFGNDIPTTEALITEGPVADNDKKVLIGKNTYDVSIRDIYLEKVFFTDEDVSELAKLTNLERITMKNCDFDSISGDVKLSGFDKLKSVSINSCYDKVDVFLYSIVDIYKIEDLTLSNVYFEDKPLNIDFSKYRNLKSLYLKDTFYILDNYIGNQTLEHIVINNLDATRSECVDFINSFENLKSYRVNDLSSY